MSVADDAGKMAVKVFRNAELPDQVSVVRKDERGIRFCVKKGAYWRAPRPAFTLLDLNMPKTSGRKTLREVETGGALSTIPFTVLTTSVASTDLVQGYDLYATGQSPTPPGYDEFLELIRTLHILGFSAEQLPPATEEATA